MLFFRDAMKVVARNAVKRFETAEEFLLALEHGVSRPLTAATAKPLAQRDPALMWRTVAVVSLVRNVLLLYLIVMR